MSMNNPVAAVIVAAALSACFSSALADDRSYSEGPVVNVARIRTVDGKTDEYLQWVATKWKAQEEASKKLGYILSYQVATVEPRGPDDPDVLLIITYKNWAALDGADSKSDAVLKELNDTQAASNAGQTSRAAIRRVLGSYTYQVLNLK
jgi:hypothetical protein